MRDRIQGFSLVEVMMALAIITFAGLTLIALFATGLNVSRESAEELEATHITQSLFATRRAAPSADLGATFALPVFNTPSQNTSANPVYLTRDGTLTTQVADAKFGLIYRIVPQTLPDHTTHVYVCLVWPVQAAAGKASGSYETYSVFLVP